MKLLLTSAGFRTEEIAAECGRLVGKNLKDIKIAIINEAHSVEDEDKHWIIEELSLVAKYFPADIDFINLLALNLEEIKKRFLKSDVIYVLGGNSDYLKSLYDRMGLSELLPTILNSKVYVGSSAGSMVMCKRLNRLAYQEIYGMRSIFGVKKYLEFTDFSFMPHLDSPYFSDRKEVIDRAAAKNSGIIYGIRDDSAIAIDGGTIKFIGSKPYSWNN